MDVPAPADGFGRASAEVGAAYAIALAMYRHEPAGSVAKPWLQGMVAAAQWRLGMSDRAPVTGRPDTATEDTAMRELMAAGQADLPGEGDPRDPAKMYARGAYRMLAYVLALRDELPVQLSAAVARAMLGQQAA